MTNFLSNLIYASDEIKRRAKEMIHIGPIENRLRFIEVVNGALYRSRQPTTKDLQHLVRIYGIKSLIVVRKSVMKHEARFAKEMKLGLLHLKLRHALPSQEMVDDFLSFVQDKNNQPILLHCRQGKDRTGLFAALYRIHIQSWPPQDAWQEMWRLGHAAFVGGRSGFSRWMEKRYDVKFHYGARMLIPNFFNIRFAMQGIWTGIHAETQVLWLTICAIAMIAFAIFMGVTKTEAAILMGMFTTTVASEMFNAGIERLADVVKPDYDEAIGKIKDLASGAVLLLAAVTFSIWVLFVFL